MRLWCWPISLGMLTLIGLVAALVSDGPWDVVSWGCLGVLLLVCAWFSLRPRD